MTNNGLSLSVSHADGRVTRWGPDELEASDIPSGLSFSTSIPGGFKDLTCDLLRRIDLDYADQTLFDTVKVVGPGNGTIWEGRMNAFPRSHGDGPSITPQAVGWNAHLKDDPSFSRIYIDRDLSGWGATSVTRRITLNAGGFSPTDATAKPDDGTGAPAIACEIQGAAWGAADRPNVEGLYDAGPGNTIGSINYTWMLDGTNLSSADTNWSWAINADSTDALSSPTTTGNLRAAGPGGGTFSAAAGDRYAAVQLRYVAAGGTANRLYGLYWTKLIVFGDHGLTTHIDSTGVGGLYASDIVAHVVQAAAPLLTYTTGAGGSIEPTTFPIPHLAFRDAITAEDAILATNAFHLYEWGVWENREFFWRAPDPDRLCWEARLADGARLDLEGDQADDVYNGVFVRYQDPAGKIRTVGPPGSTAEATDASLEITGATNAANAHGIPRKWAKLEISQTTTQAGAIQLGAIMLAEKAAPQRRGTLTLTGTVSHPTKGKRPAYEVRAGDYVRISDHPADVPRRIIETRYTHDSRQLSATLDNSSQRLDAILERFGAALIGRV